MSSKREIKPGMLVLWRSSCDAPTLPKERFLGLVVAEVNETERLGRYSRLFRQFLVFVRTRTTQDKTAIRLYEHELVPFFEKKNECQAD